MPLIGHAFVGWATALESRPRGHGAPGTGALFVPVVIAAAYFPDAFAQLGLLAGWADASRAGHSLLLALVATPVVAAAVSAAGGLSYARGLLVAGVTIGLHDLLDILQSTDREPWWPFSDRPLALRPLLPESPLGEAVVFGVLFLLYLVVARLRRRPGARGAGRAPTGRLAWAGRIGTAALLTLAVVTHGLRGRRERQLEAARASIEHGDARAGLLLLADAARWPSTARAGRVDYLTAEAHAARGERALAEEHYLRSRRADPGYFWSLADLALFYARGPEPADERRRRVLPLLERLRADHPGHAALPRVLAQAERALARPVGDLDKVPAPGP